jgi:thiol-disulfide isomerase/thioredoxin
MEPYHKPEFSITRQVDSGGVHLPVAAPRAALYDARMDLFRKVSMRVILCTGLAVAAVSATHKPEPAPRFKAKTTNGETFSNDSVKGKVVLLQFWATWCQYCRKEQAIVDSLDAEFKDKGLIVLAIDVGESRKTVKQYLAANPRECRIVFNEDTNLAAMYAASAYPIYVVIDREGNIAGIQRGAAGEYALRNLLGKGGLESE